MYNSTSKIVEFTTEKQLEFQPSAFALANNSGMLREYMSPYRHFDEIVVKVLAKEIARFYRCNDDLYSTMVDLTNASGTGKTRAAIELGNLTNVLLFKYEDYKSSYNLDIGGLINDFFHDQENGFTTSHQLCTMYALDVVLQRILYICGSVYASEENLPNCMLVDDVIKWHYQAGMVKERFVQDVLSDLKQGVKTNHELMQYFDSEERLRGFADHSKFTYNNGEPILYNGMTMEEIVRHNRSWLVERQKALGLKLGSEYQSTVQKLPPLVIVFDEARHIMGEYSDLSKVRVTGNLHSNRVDMYFLYKGAFRNSLFFSRNSICLTVCTKSKDVKFDPEIDNPSYRWNPKKQVNNPIILLDTFDCFFDKILVESSVNDWKEFLFGKERILLIESCGRPSWGAHLLKRTRQRWRDRTRYIKDNPDKLSSFSKGNEEYGICQNVVYSPSRPIQPFNIINENAFVEMFRKLGDSVIGPCHRPADACNVFYFKNMDEAKVVSLLSLSVAMDKVPKGFDLVKETSDGPFALLGMDYEERKIHVKTCSEGILNGCASLMLLRNHEYVGQWIINLAQSAEKSFLSKDELGEIIERISILKAVKQSSRQEVFELLNLKTSSSLPKSIPDFLFEPVGIRAFLTEYIGREVTCEYLKIHPGLEGSFVAFSHFVYMGAKKLQGEAYDIAANALSRGAAIVPCQGTRGVNIFIPLVLKTGEISFVYIRNKTGSKYTRHPSAQKVQLSSPENRLFGKVFEASSAPIAKIDRPHVYIYRQYCDSPTCEYLIFDRTETTFTTSDRRGKTERTHQYQPCVSITGRLTLLDGPFLECLKVLCKPASENNHSFIEHNLALKKVWLNPSELPHMTVEDVKNIDNHIQLSLDDEPAEQESVAKKARQ